MFKWMESMKEFLAANDEATIEKRIMLPIKPRIEFMAQKTRFLSSKEEVLEMVHDLLSQDMRLLAIDTEFRYGNKKFLKLKKDRSPRKNAKEWTDIKSIVPLLLSLCAVVDDKKFVYVIDLRVDGITEALQKLLNSGVKVAVHYVKAEYHCLKTIGITFPTNLFDSHLGALALNLGKFHHRYISENPESDKEAQENKAQSDGKKLYHSSLLGVCQKYGIKHHFRNSKKKLQLSFDKVGPNESFTQEQIEYAAEDAIVEADIYYAMCSELIAQDLISHMEKIEFPYALSNAECEWVGVRVSDEACNKVVLGLTKAVREYEKTFRAHPYNIVNPNSRNEILSLFTKLGILKHFTVRSRAKKTGRNVPKYSFSRDVLERNQNIHDVVLMLRNYKKSHQKASEKLFHGEFRSCDGRVHASLLQLGSDTGRTTSVDPPLNSTGKIFRPIVIPEEGWKIGEADLSQIEMGVAAAISKDPQLIADYNGGDIYMQIAKRMFRHLLSPAQLAYTIKEFKKDPFTRNLRDRMKVFCLGVIYNMSPAGVARDLGISEAQARLEIELFFSHYPVLRNFMEESAIYGGFRGFARSITGLKRFRAKPSIATTHWEVNWLRNMPIQASAADLFKLIVIKLTQEYKRFGAKLILQIYDSVVFEVPAEYFEDVAELTKIVMEATVSEVFPVLRGKVDVNTENPFCWNKDGKTDSIEQFLLNPEYKI